MAIPGFQSLMRPFLDFIKDGQEHLMKSIVLGLADQFQLSNDEREQILPSGQQAIFFNRVGWARTYLKYAGLLESVGRGVVRISPSGVKLLKSHRGPICSKDLEKYNSFLEFKNKAIKTVETVSNLSEVMTILTPQEQIEFAYEQSSTTAGLVIYS